MNNLFSSFDPSTTVIFLSAGFNWLSAASVILFIPPGMWLASSQISTFLNLIFKFLNSELSAIFGPLQSPGSVLVFFSFFLFILFSNFLGLFPYVFTASSHLVFSLSLSLPLWLGTMIWSFIFQFNHMAAHLVPLGTPGILMPVMVMIETISSLIRPFTLAVRLAANMIAGHLLLTLLGSQGSLNFDFSAILVILALMALLTLECAVACIQSYVFTVLSSLYLSELCSTEFSKLNKF